MPAFEPSTWAEVEEALASRKATAQVSDAFVTRVRAFTDAPERFLSSAVSAPYPKLSHGSVASDAISSDGEDAPPQPAAPREIARKRLRHPLSHIKRNDGQFDDLLGLGKVDVETQSLVRRVASQLNVDELSIVPSFGIGRNFSDNPVNPSSESFDANVYLAKVHRMNTLEDLVQGKETLTKLRERLDSEAEQFRREKYVSAALVEAAFESTKKSLRPISPFAFERGGVDTEETFEQAGAMLKARYEEVLSRETKLTRLRRTLGVYTRYQWIFALGSRLRSAATDGIAAIETAVREYIRGLKWLEAQEGASLSMIEKDIESGYSALIDSLLTQLSTGHFSRPETSRLVGVLTSVKREELLTEALSKRMSFAMDGLQKSSEAVDMASILDVQDAVGKTQRETTELISRASSAFFEGLSHVWGLGRVLMGQERWLRIVDLHLFELCGAYASILRENMLSDVALVSRDAVKEIASVKNRAINDLNIPVSCLRPLVEANNEISECFLLSIARSVKSNAERLAAQAVSADTVGAQTAQRLCLMLTEALEQVDDSLVNNRADLQGADEKTASVSVAERTLEEQMGKTTLRAGEIGSGLSLLGKACAEMPGTFAREIYDLMVERYPDQESSSLKMAVCCTELIGTVVGAIGGRTGPTTPFDTPVVKGYLSESESVIREILEMSTTKYVNLVSKPVQQLVAGLVSFPEEELEDSVSRTVPIKIEGISKSANEVTLQLALITIAIRKCSEDTDLIRSILLALVQDIGRTLVDVLSTDKLVYHRAAQLWVDVTYMQDMITRGADSDAHGLQDALDGYSRVKERAVQAVLADGYSFSLADMGVLRETVVATGMTLAQMVQDCFRETWALLRGVQAGNEH